MPMGGQEEAYFRLCPWVRRASLATWQHVPAAGVAVAKGGGARHGAANGPGCSYAPEACRGADTLPLGLHVVPLARPLEMHHRVLSLEF